MTPRLPRKAQRGKCKAPASTRAVGQTRRELSQLRVRIAHFPAARACFAAQYAPGIGHAHGLLSAHEHTVSVTNRTASRWIHTPGAAGDHHHHRRPGRLASPSHSKTKI